MADRLAQAGAEVIVTVRNSPEKLTHHFIATDLTNPDQSENFAKTISERFGKIDILINNIDGLARPSGGYSYLTDEHWENEFKLNLFAETRLERNLLPQILEA